MRRRIRAQTTVSLNSRSTTTGCVEATVFNLTALNTKRGRMVTRKVAKAVLRKFTRETFGILRQWTYGTGE